MRVEQRYMYGLLILILDVFLFRQDYSRTGTPVSESLRSWSGDVKMNGQRDPTCSPT